MGTAERRKRRNRVLVEHKAMAHTNRETERVICAFVIVSCYRELGRWVKSGKLVFQCVCEEWE